MKRPSVGGEWTYSDGWVYPSSSRRVVGGAPLDSLSLHHVLRACKGPSLLVRKAAKGLKVS